MCWNAQYIWLLYPYGILYSIGRNLVQNLYTLSFFTLKYPLCKSFSISESLHQWPYNLGTTFIEIRPIRSPPFWPGSFYPEFDGPQKCPKLSQLARHVSAGLIIPSFFAFPTILSQFFDINLMQFFLQHMKPVTRI